MKLPGIGGLLNSRLVWIEERLFSLLDFCAFHDLDAIMNVYESTGLMVGVEQLGVGVVKYSLV